MTERDCDTKPGAFRGTPFHSSTAARNASPWWYGWGGYVVPDVSPRVRWDHLPLCADDGVVGRASSVTWSPSTSQLIGFGLVLAGLAEAGTELAVVWADYWGQELGLAAARVCEYPFIDLGRQV